PLIAGDGVGLGVAEHRAHVQRPGDRGWWGVDRVHVLTRHVLREAVGAVFFPTTAPALFQTVDRWLFGNTSHVGSKGDGRTRRSTNPKTRSYSGAVRTVMVGLALILAACEGLSVQSPSDNAYLDSGKTVDKPRDCGG